MSVFLDFDGTITAQDTIGELASFALRFQEEQRQRQGQGQKREAAPTSASTSTAGPAPTDVKPDSEPPSDLAREWDAVVGAYLADYRAGADAHHTPPGRRVSAAQEIEFLRALKAVEERSLHRVRRCGLFRDVPPAALRAVGARLIADGKVRLRPGFHEFVDRVAAAEGEGTGKGFQIYVVSVNWSAKFIEGAVGYRPEGTGEEGRGRVSIEVLANDVRGEDGAIVGPGILDPGDERADGTARVLTNSQDKLDVMQTVLRREERLAGRPSVYVGDSNTDLECLLAADRGIVMADGPDSALLQTLKRIGRDVPHIRDTGGARGISWTSDFTDILENVEFW